MSSIIMFVLSIVALIVTKFIEFPKKQINNKVIIIGVFVIFAFLTGTDLYLKYKSKKLESKNRDNIEDIYKMLKDLKGKSALTLYLDDIKIDTLKQYITKQEFDRVIIKINEFNKALDAKNKEELSKIVNEILKIIPVDPFFRIYKYALDDRIIDRIFNGQYKIVRVINWEHDIEGDEKYGVSIITSDGTEESNVVYGPFTNKQCSVIDKPLKKYVQIKIEASGVGRFKYYPRSFRIGWAIAESKDGEWIPNKNAVEYDPFIRFNFRGELIEW